ncbi:MAG: PIG-L family deacetylase, partial [Acidobacteria bacterium]|nr:PIG-L family deacetylase [Acidobacteriota bacterium]
MHEAEPHEKIPRAGKDRLIAALAFSFASNLSPARAQEASPTPTPATQSIDKAELHQAVLDLTNPWTVMCIAAHPDDEDGTTLTVLRRKYGVHTVSLFSTYGEGGQNAVGPELYEELGVIRTRETLKASEIQGSEPHFLGLNDFGFSKSAEETFKAWGQDEALRRLVLKIRELRPDVIITNHDTSRGHGHHQATGRLVLEAFDAAADSKRFSEQLNKLKPWQVQRLFVRVFGGAASQPLQGATERIISIDPNEIDPVRGTTFAEQALTALQQHATQGPWPKSMAQMLRARRIESGKLQLIRYRLIREAKSVPSLPESATTPLDGLELLQVPEGIQPDIAAPKIDGRPLTEFVDRPDRVLAALVDWRASQTPEPSPAKDSDRLHLFESRANRALAIASGVSLTLSSRAPVLVPGVNTTFSIEIANAGSRSVTVDDLRFHSWGQVTPVKTADLLLPDTETVVTVDSTTPKNATLTVPNEEHLYDGLFLGKPFSAVATLEIDGARFFVSAESAREVAPAVEIRKISPSLLVWTPGRRDQTLTMTATVRNNLEAPFRGVLALNSQALGISAVGASVTLNANETRPVALRSNAGAFNRSGSRPGSRAKFNLASVLVEDTAATPITRRNVPVVFSDARVAPGIRVGYVASYDQTLEHALAALGVNSKALTIEAIMSSELSMYDTIIIDNRGYEAHPELIVANQRLLEFVNAGGTLLVFYHKSNEWNPDPSKKRPQLAPYPIVLGEERVTDETAPVKFLLPRHRLLNFPNRIRQADFANWIQERGLYYPKQWDEHYSALLSTHDPGEPPLTGGLLVGPYGKGAYIYTSMVWYR